ncbi:GcrA family cell cycle regulator [Acetobacter conturbans]|uniref:GcrA cell cycle regulator n=1 Tax=Acetobacter conturbans TaxID=1737472 RepID=A0ABX0K0V3_9PROT|nr:GcrA family cell cycle regulator [Acetobacter conturbans]NHN87369.1 GcrA cell cycle regulator [Acetobacter conturbans]
MEWTDETIARLKALWQEGLSTAEIGRQLGITKNAVVGKAHRLALPPRPSPIRRQDGKGTVKKSAEGGERPKAPSPRKPVKVEAVSGIPSVPDVVSVAPAEQVAASAKAVSVDRETVSQPAAVMTADSVSKPSSAPVVSEKRPEPVKQVATVSSAKADVAVAVRVQAPAAPQRKATPVPRSAVQRLASAMEPRRRSASCCWPLGDPGMPGFHFCGATPLPGKPYCAEHAALAYVKLRDRRDSGS